VHSFPSSFSRPNPIGCARLWTVAQFSCVGVLAIASLLPLLNTSLLSHLRLSPGMTIQDARHSLGEGAELSLARVPMLMDPDGALRPALQGNYFHMWEFRDGVLCAGFRDGLLVSSLRVRDCD
jgi:hypothetical protein